MIYAVERSKLDTQERNSTDVVCNEATGVQRWGVCKCPRGRDTGNFACNDTIVKLYKISENTRPCIDIHVCGFAGNLCNKGTRIVILFFY